MQRTAPGLRTDPATRLAELGRQRPEWSTWVRLLAEVLPLLDDAGWPSSLPEAGDPTGGDKGRSPGQPLLHGARLVVDTERVHRLLHNLTRITAAQGVPDAPALVGYQPPLDILLDLIAGAVRHDHASIGEIAAAAAVDAAALDVIAQLTALPLLRSCGRLLGDEVPAHWPHGHCPICGSWPLLGEFRSLDRTRRLRCGRCTADWRINWLHCPYCDETNHEKLGSLVLEEKLGSVTVETCFRCLGYLKSVTTLQAIGSEELLLRDLETVEMDMAALDRGFVRPGGAGFPVELRLTSRASYD